MKIFSLLLIILFFCETIIGQELIADKNIHTLMCHKKGWPLSYPVIQLNSNEKIVCCFDDFSPFQRDFYYVLRHCDKTWNSSNISYNEYAKGFEINRIYNVTSSINTTYAFYHYTLEIPNDDVEILYSGNYLLCVYGNSELSDLIFTKKIYVCEQSARIDANIKRPVIPTFADSHQEIEFTVFTDGLPVINPAEDITAIISQNNRWDNSRMLKARFADRKKLIFDYDEKLLFPGLNEFRFFNIRDLKSPFENVYSINYRPPYYYVSLKQEKDKTFSRYTAEKDINGKFYIQSVFKEQDMLRADYVHVTFSLASDIPVIEGNVCILGALTNWQCTPASYMEYDFENKMYQTSLLLKQGYYNYLYAVKNSKTQEIDASFFEGSHALTENDYLIFIYLSGTMQKYDRLVAFDVANIRKNN